MPNSSIWPIDRTQSGATTSGKNGPGSDDNEGKLRILQSSSITGTSLSFFVSAVIFDCSVFNLQVRNQPCLAGISVPRLSGYCILKIFLFPLNFVLRVVSWHGMWCRHAVKISLLKSWCVCAIGVSQGHILGLKAPNVILQFANWPQCSQYIYTVLNVVLSLGGGFSVLNPVFGFAVGFQGRIMRLVVSWIFRAESWSQCQT